MQGTPERRLVLHKGCSRHTGAEPGGSRHSCHRSRQQQGTGGRRTRRHPRSRVCHLQGLCLINTLVAPSCVLFATPYHSHALATKQEEARVMLPGLIPAMLCYQARECCLLLAHISSHNYTAPR